MYGGSKKIISNFSFFSKKSISIKNYEIIEKNIFNENIFLKLDDKFDIVFLDPPYKYKDLDNILYGIKEKRILKQNGIIILHRHKDEKDNFLLDFEIIEKKMYGISKIIFLSNLD